MTVQENVNLENSEESESSEDFEFSIEINSNIEKNSKENASIENNSTENASIKKHVSEESRECSRSNIDQSRNLETTNENNFSYIEFILKKSVPESSFPAFVERFKKAYIVNDSLIYLDDAAVNELFPVEIGMRGIFKANLKKFLEKKSKTNSVPQPIVPEIYEVSEEEPVASSTTPQEMKSFSTWTTIVSIKFFESVLKFVVNLKF